MTQFTNPYKYHVTTQNRTYNSIISRKHLSEVMEGLADTGEIVMVCVWENGKGWIKTNPEEMD